MCVKGCGVRHSYWKFAICGPNIHHEVPVKRESLCGDRKTPGNFFISSGAGSQMLSIDMCTLGSPKRLRSGSHPFKHWGYMGIDVQ